MAALCVISCDANTSRPDADGDADSKQPPDQGRGDRDSTDPAGTATLSPPDGCPGFDGPERLGTAPTLGLPEASGLGVSRMHAGFWWTHNDSGAGPVALLLDPKGNLRSRVRLRGASSVDWEDLAVVRGPDGVARVYVADMGDNFRRRKTISLHRFTEPTADDVTHARLRVDVETVELAYPDGARDAEALLVDPRTLQVVIVSKARDGHSGIYVAEDPFAGGRGDAPAALSRAGELVFGKAMLRGSEMVTAGDVAPAGDAILLRTYSTACLYARGPEETLAEALLAQTCCPVPLAPEPQGEAITFLPDGRGYATISEGDASPIWGFSPAP